MLIRTRGSAIAEEPAQVK